MTLYEARQIIKIGSKYRHYKGGVYTVDNIAIDTDTGFVVVVYHNEINEYFVRRASEWLDTVMIPQYVARFELIEDDKS
mgnify:CR=1 FL=1